VKLIPPLIRSEFKKYKNKKYKREGIFISFGGSDAKNISLKVLKVLKKQKVNLYTTTANKNLKKLKRFCRINKWCRLHINENIALAMAKSKFAIITPSSIAWEATYMKLPFIAIEVADNQKYISRYLKQKRVKILKIRDIRKINDFIPYK